MPNHEQQQAAEDGSTALQAGRDIIIHGPSVNDVRELCLIFLRENFPILKDEATRTAETHVKAFAKVLGERLVDDAASIVLERLADPDVQAAINDAVQASARRGDNANPGILSALISARLAMNTNDYKDIVLSEAVQVVPRLTGPQIALVSFVHFVRSMFYQNLSSIASLEDIGQKALRFSRAGFGLSVSQKRHLQYSGAASVNNLLEYKLFDQQNTMYSSFGIPNGEAFREALKSNAPSYLQLLDQFVADHLFAVELTSVGSAIALANISNHMGPIDYTIWLN